MALRRPHASSPNLPYYRRGAANLSRVEKKAPQMTIKPDQYFMKMKCFGTVYSGWGAAGRRDPPPPNKRIRSSYHAGVFIIRHFYTGSRQSMNRWGHNSDHGSGQKMFCQKIKERKCRLEEKSFQKAVYESFIVKKNCH